MIENSANEMYQVVNCMLEAESWEDMDLNQYEEANKHNLFNLCKEYVNQFNRLSQEEVDLEV